MYLVTDRSTNLVLGYGETLSFQDNGYPMIEEINMAFPPQLIYLYSNIELPKDISTEYYYTEKKGFYKLETN